MEIIQFMTGRLLMPGFLPHFQARPMTEKLLMKGPAILGSLIIAE
jgi:hypothetical protein